MVCYWKILANTIRNSSKLVRIFFRMQKLIYIAPRDTVEMPTKTNHHLIVCYQGREAGSMFIPAYDINLIKIHEKQFNKTKKIPKRKYKPIKGDFIVDKHFKFKPDLKTFSGDGPVVLFDNAHLSSNTPNVQYKPLAKLLKSDGYTIKSIPYTFTENNLAEATTLVMSNVYGQNINGWFVNSDKALLPSEFMALKKWIYNGGQLLLIADHHPYPSRVDDIAGTFGFNLWDAQVVNKNTTNHIELINRELSTLNKHAITEGRNDNEIIDQIATFGGACMEIPPQAESIITLNDDYVAVFPQTTENLRATDYKQSAKGKSQGAVMKYGKGRIAIFCESHMFTALTHESTQNSIGMNHPYANENGQFILNIFHWLNGFLD